MRVLVTCPPMLGRIDHYRARFTAAGVELETPNVVQTLSETELVKLLPEMDGWIIGDDPATRRVFEAGKQGKLKAAVKWGVGVDNVDFSACQDLGIPISNTPGMFGDEVANVAIGYLIGLARETYLIDRGVRAGDWPKPPGQSLRGATVGLIGFGDIGRSVGERLPVFGLNTIVYDPFAEQKNLPRNSRFAAFPEAIETLDYLIITAALTDGTRGMINAEILAQVKPGLRLVNISRGPIIDEAALTVALQSGQVYSAALDVFEVEPLPADSPLRQFDRCVFGTHNGSNTVQAVDRTSQKAMDLLFGFLKIEQV